MSKKKKNELFDDITKHGIATTGAVGVTGLAGRMPFSPSSGAITGSMGMIRVPLTTHAVGIAFKGLHSLEELSKKAKRR